MNDTSQSSGSQTGQAVIIAAGFLILVLFILIIPHVIYPAFTPRPSTQLQSVVDTFSGYEFGSFLGIVRRLLERPVISTRRRDGSSVRRPPPAPVGQPDPPSSNANPPDPSTQPQSVVDTVSSYRFDSFLVFVRRLLERPVISTRRRDGSSVRRPPPAPIGQPDPPSSNANPPDPSTQPQSVVDTVSSYIFGSFLGFVRRLLERPVISTRRRDGSSVRRPPQAPVWQHARTYMEHTSAARATPTMVLPPPITSTPRADTHPRSLS